MRRFYREWVKADGFIKTHLSVEETDIEILSESALDKVWLKQRIVDYRRDIQRYIDRDPRFLNALKPIHVELDAPEIVKQMAEAARFANVGPMAAVAGCIAQFLTQDLLNRGYKEIIIENGGDIFMSRQIQARSIGIYAGGSRLSGRISLLIKATQTPCGVCTSSATFGHSLSFGRADGVVILAKDAAVSDALATAACNMVNSKDDFKKAIAFARKIKGVFGVVIILGDNLASWGEIEIK